MKRFLAGILVLIMLCMAGITASSEVIIPMTWEEAQSMYVTSSDHVLYIQEGRFIIKAVYADTGRLYMVERGTTMDGIYSYIRSFYDEAGNVVETTSGSEEIQPLMQTTLVRDYSGSVIGVRCTIGTEGYMVAYGMVFRLVNYNDTWYQYPCESFDSVPEPYRTAMLNVYPYIDPYPPIGPVVKAGWEQVGKQWKYKMAED